MGMPEIRSSNVTRSQAITDILQSIALEEAALRISSTPREKIAVCRLHGLHHDRQIDRGQRNGSEYDGSRRQVRAGAAGQTGQFVPRLLQITNRS